MRFIITLILSLILLIPASGQGQWEIVNLGIYIPIYDIPRVGTIAIDDIHDVQFLDQDKGFISTGLCAYHFVVGFLHKTEDGGKTWKLIYESSPNDLSSFHFINESKGFGTGQGGNCGETDQYHTTSDSGYSWTETKYPLGWVTDIFFLNDTIGWAYGQLRRSIYSALYKTMDGGENWNEVIRGQKDINSLFFIDEESGWAVEEGGSINKYNRNDGWNKQIVGTGLPLNKVFFVDRNNGWVTGGYSNEDSFNPIFMRTVDGGETWTNNTDMNYLINDFYFEDKYHGWAVGEYAAIIGVTKITVGVILETFNSGIDWKLVKDLPHKRLNALHISDGVGWAVGDNGLVLTNDSIATGIDEDNKINGNNEPLFQNYPNPFQSSTTITFQLPAVSDVELSVYDISGREVATLVNERQQPDRYEVEWNAEGMESGIYFCELKTGQGRQVMKMILTR